MENRPRLGTPAHVAKPARPGPGRPKGSVSGPAPRYPIPKKTGNKDETDRLNKHRGNLTFCLGPASTSYDEATFRTDRGWNSGC